MSEAQITWASKHDWFLAEVEGAILGCDHETGAVVRFANFKDMYVWAGY